MAVHRDPDVELTARAGLDRSRKLLEFARTAANVRQNRPAPGTPLKSIPQEGIPPQSIPPKGILPKSTPNNHVSISSNYTRLDNDVSDLLLPLQTPTEQTVYLRLYRLSWGFHRRHCQAGYGALARQTGLCRSAVQAAIATLIAKGHISTGQWGQTGRLYQVFLPAELEGFNSTTQIVSATIPPTSIPDKSIPPKGIPGDRIVISSNYTRLDNDVSDLLLRLQTPTEQTVYLRLYRLSWGFHRRHCQAGYGALARQTGLCRSAVQAAVAALIAKGHISTGQWGQTGRLYQVFLPAELEGFNSTTELSEGDDGIARNGIPPQGIPPEASTIPPQGIPPDRVRKDLKYSSVVKENLKNSLSLSLSLIDPFYRQIGQTKISREKMEKSERVLLKLLQENYTEDEIQFAIQWTIKNIPNVHSFAILPDVMGQALSEKPAADTSRQGQQLVQSQETARAVSLSQAQESFQHLDEPQKQTITEQAEQMIPEETRSVVPPGTLIYRNMVHGNILKIMMNREQNGTVS